MSEIIRIRIAYCTNHSIFLIIIYNLIEIIYLRQINGLYTNAFLYLKGVFRSCTNASNEFLLLRDIGWLEIKRHKPDRVAMLLFNVAPESRFNQVPRTTSYPCIDPRALDIDV